MSQVNRPPFGLQSFLGSKNFGVNPSELGQTFLPVIDSFPFLSSGLVDYRRNTATVTATGQNIAISVPSGELWLVERISMEWQYESAGDEVQWTIEIKDQPNEPAGATWFVLTDTGRRTAAAIGATEFLNFHAERPMPVWSGTAIRTRAVVFIPTGVAQIFPQIQVQFVRLTI